MGPAAESSTDRQIGASADASTDLGPRLHFHDRFNCNDREVTFARAERHTRERRAKAAERT
jgi:hypothetical protein